MWRLARKLSQSEMDFLLARPVITRKRRTVIRQTYTRKIYDCGQITITKAIREKLGIELGDELVIELVEDSSFTVKPARASGDATTQKTRKEAA